MSKPREFTAEEVGKQFMQHLAAIAHYWATLPDKTPLERCNGLAFSVLNIFDGTSMALPALDLVVRPHPDDKAYCIANGENWYVDGQVVEGASHEIWPKYERK